MRHRAHADDVQILEEETGFRLQVISEDGDVFMFDIQHLAWDLAAQVDATLGAWRREGETARLSGESSENSGYDPSDSKHPDWHSVQSGIHDNRSR